MSINTRNIANISLSCLLGIIVAVFSLDSCKKLPVGFFHMTTDTVYTYVPVQGSYFLEGTIASLGEYSISEHGFCWSETRSPTPAHSSTSLGSRSSRGSFSSIINSLSASTTYYFRAYAETDEGIRYGEELNFTTLSGADTVVDYDGNVYQTILIGSQTWMAENLKVTHYADGSPIPLVEANSAWEALTIDDKAYCWYENNSSYGDTYGALYTWEAAMNGSSSSDINPSGIQGVCPAGWHLPGDTEWKELEIHLGMSSIDADKTEWRGTDEGGMLKETGTEHWNSPNTGATNESGFTALPGGHRSTYGEFFHIGAFANFWQATAYTEADGWSRTLFYESAAVYRLNFAKDGGLSVRCVKGAGFLTTPTVNTSPISDISETSALCGGEVTNNGGTALTARGVCWSITPGPTISDNLSTEGTGTGEFTSTLSGLSPGTTYYVRAYATNGQGTAYGDELSFMTWSGSVTDYDGNIYPTIEIGSQVWIAENLKTSHYTDGSPITFVEELAAWDILTETDKAYCWYDNDTVNGNTYGALYTWSAVMNGAVSSDQNPSGVQGLCPDGWHIPSDSEWKELEMHLGMSQEDADNTNWRGTNEGGKLKEAGTSHWVSPNTGASNGSGFTAIPGGLLRYGGSFEAIGHNGYWWSSTQFSSNNAWCRHLFHNNAGVFRYHDTKIIGFSARCLQD